MQRREVDRPASAHALQGRPAGFVSRLGAAVVDGVVIAVCVAVIYAGVIGVRFAVSPTTFEASSQPTWLLGPLSFVFILAYFTQWWCTTGRTYGAALMGLRVVTRDGATPRLARSFVRALLCILFPLGLLWVACSPANRSVQDLVARTDVIYDWWPHEPDVVS